MKVIIDSREKKCDHIKAWFDKKEIEYEVKKLDVGDFMLEDKANVSVDRKQNLSELSRNLTNKTDHSRFWKEVRRAREQGIKLYVLCEHGGKIKSIQDVALWNDKYSGVIGRNLMNEIYRVHISYGVQFLFCSKRSTAKKIIEILEGEYG
ncbi:MAG: ERCC4 domain-containing protein [Bacteroidales bacterium]|nr:ERCC4 domain-containing protein [Bacteroidales bacterium]